MIRTLHHTNQFKKDWKKVAKNTQLPLTEVREVITILANIGTLPLKYKDHKLTGKLTNSRGINSRGCHIMF